MNFNSKSVCKIIGLSIRQIDYWDRTHFIKPSVSEALGYGSVRLYSFNDLIQLRVANTLLDKGVSLQKIRKAIIYLKKNMPEIKKPLLELTFLTDGETIFVLTKNDKKIIDTLKSGQLVFSIAVGKIVEDLKGEVIAFQKERRYIVIAGEKKYSVILYPDASGQKGERYRIECPSLPSCVSRGDTVEEALGMIKHNIERHLSCVNPLNSAFQRR